MNKRIGILVLLGFFLLAGMAQAEIDYQRRRRLFPLSGICQMGS